MAGKSKSMVFRFCDVPEKVAAIFKATCKHCPAAISASAKSTSNFLIHLKVKLNTYSWNSQLSMVRSIVRNLEDKLHSLDMQHQLTLYDWNILRDSIDILTPLESATHCV